MSKHRRLFRFSDRVSSRYLDIQAWHRLLPDWAPTLDALNGLDTEPPEFRNAVRRLSREWEQDDARWDILLAILEYSRRRGADQPPRGISGYYKNNETTVEVAIVRDEKSE